MRGETAVRSKTNYSGELSSKLSRKGRRSLAPSMLLSSDWTLAIDSTGIKVSDRGEWMREKWHVHRGWIKVHMAVEVVWERSSASR